MNFWKKQVITNESADDTPQERQFIEHLNSMSNLIKRLSLNVQDVYVKNAALSLYAPKSSEWEDQNIRIKEAQRQLSLAMWAYDKELETALKLAKQTEKYKDYTAMTAHSQVEYFLNRQIMTNR